MDLLLAMTRLLAASTSEPPYAMASFKPRLAKALPTYVGNSFAIHSGLSLGVGRKGGRKEVT